MAGIFVTSNRVTVFHVGDSRVYSYTGGHLIQATTDDSDPNSGLITQVFGGSRSFLPVRVHLSTQPSEAAGCWWQPMDCSPLPTPTR